MLLFFVTFLMMIGGISLGLLFQAESETQFWFCLWMFFHYLYCTYKWIGKHGSTYIKIVLS